MIAQCATCIHEPQVMFALGEMTGSMQEFNAFYLAYQKAAKLNKCPDYFPAFHGGKA